MVQNERRIIWVGDSKKALLAFLKEVRVAVGHALSEAQAGRKVGYAKPMSEFSAGVFEIVADFDGDTYRGVYAVKLGADIYVLHAFKKKSTSSIATPRPDLELIKRRIKQIQSR
jgi:phage-related protein